MKTHGHTAGGRQSPTYISWYSMMARCNRPTAPNFIRYGAKGIKVCERWEKFENFLEDMGERPVGRSIDRIKNDLGYFKDNCRWATRKEQQNNQSTNRIITFIGVSLNRSQWAELLGIGEATIARRLSRGWSVESALVRAVV